MKKTTNYVAKDGKVFDNEEDCRKHEIEISKSIPSILEEFGEAFNAVMDDEDKKEMEKIKAEVRETIVNDKDLTEAERKVLLDIMDTISLEDFAFCTATAALLS